MTQSQSDLYNAAQAALKEAAAKLDLLERSTVSGLVEPGAKVCLNGEALQQARIDIKTALLWLREI